MKVKNLSAKGAHGYLDINVEFNADLTFLTGLNGSGKTTALKMLVALLTPSPEEFAMTSFSTAEVRVDENGRTTVIAARKDPEGVEFRIDTVQEAMFLSSSELQLMIESRRREQHRATREDAISPVQEKIMMHPVYVAIKKMSTPMFLGLDRQLFSSSWLRDDLFDIRRREYVAHRMLRDADPSRSAGVYAGLIDVNYLVLEKVQEIRLSQERLDEDLRRKFFTRAFEYKPTNMKFGAGLPSREELERYRQHLTTIERAAEGLRLPVPELKAALSGFFERMSGVVDTLEVQAKRSKKNRSKDIHLEMANNDFLEWIVNKPQSDRILEHLTLLDEYVSSRASLHKPIDRFVNLINSFLTQTKKRVSVADSGELQVHLQDGGAARSITALSSGERQLLVMLGHLALNPSLEKSAVFIVDEPELSLHVAWQERFVDAITEANPSVQYILATHSPAIIMDRVDFCCSLS